MDPISTPAAGVEPIAYADKSGIADPSKMDKVFSEGFDILQSYMALLSQQAGDYHKQMKRNGDISNDAQKAVGGVDASIGWIDSQKERGEECELTPEVREYCLNHIDLFPGTGIIKKDETGVIEWTKAFSASDAACIPKHGMVEIRTILQNYATAHSDAVSQDQLQVQKIMQTYNVTVSLMNSLQTLMGDMNKMVAQNIRW